MTPTDDRIRVKVCGITNLEDARCAAGAGADLLGFIFYPKSPRFVTPECVAGITHAIRNELGARAPTCVGVFVDEREEFVRSVLDAAHLDLAQLHGSEPPAAIRQQQPRAFKAIRPRTCGEAEAALTAYRDTFLQDEALPQLLLDAYHPERPGGTGLQAEWSMARSVAAECRLLLAGGLTPETVAAAIEAVQPWGVDVSSGVERDKGVKDHSRVRAFIHAVRGEP
jgi:phosphoribosylanthranilate isomerase